MKKGIHYTIYGIGLLLSITFIGLYFIDKENAWCILSCSIGASLIGAVVLGYFIDLSNSRNKSEQSKRIFQIAHGQLYSTINSLLMVVYHPLKQFYKLKDDKTEFKYENLSVRQLIEKYIETIKEIKTYIAPVISSNETTSSCELDLYRKQQNVTKMINEYKESILDFRKQFKELWKNAKQQQNLLLVNDSSYEKEIFQAIAILSILSYQRTDLGKEQELIELGNSLQELIDCKFIDILDKIGFEKVRFNNKKGYFDIRLIKEK